MRVEPPLPLSPAYMREGNRTVNTGSGPYPLRVMIDLMGWDCGAWLRGRPGGPSSDR